MVLLFSSLIVSAPWHLRVTGFLAFSGVIEMKQLHKLGYKI